jgi:hypothetical protein
VLVEHCLSRGADCCARPCKQHSKQFSHAQQHARLLAGGNQQEDSAEQGGNVVHLVVCGRWSKCPICEHACD